MALRCVRIAVPASPATRKARTAAALAVVTLAGVVASAAGPQSAAAWRGAGHDYTANAAAAEIYAGRAVVTLSGRPYAVPTPIAQSIKAFPDFFRGGSIGPDAFPDIPAGQGSIHPDTHTDNGRHVVDNSRGTSYTWEWLKLVYDAGWARYRQCGGCAEGQQVLAFTYGFLVHAAADVFAHTLVNRYAEGVFPAVRELGSYGSLRIALRHLIVEGYIDKHTYVDPAA